MSSLVMIGTPKFVLQKNIVFSLKFVLREIVVMEKKE